MIRALAFDIQGTTVDFHEPLMRVGAETNARKGIELDWTRIGAKWRRLYRETMDTVIDGHRPWLRVDLIYREALDTLLERECLSAVFSADERDTINAFWSRLDPWPDSVPGLARLRRKYALATLSNAGMAALVAVVRHAALPFDAVLSAELARSYKPAPDVYRLAVDYLGFAPDEIMMVACHKYDLVAAQAFGMRAAFVARPFEFGPHGLVDTASEARFEVNAADFNDLSEKLGA